MIIDDGIQKELETLRLEIENLKEQKKQTQDTKIIENKDIEATITKFLESTHNFKGDAKDSINELLKTIKKDYANISPITAIGLFAIGMIFGRVTSSK